MSELTDKEQRDMYTKVSKIYGAIYGEGDTSGVIKRLTKLEESEQKRLGIIIGVSAVVSCLSVLITNFVSWFRG